MLKRFGISLSVGVSRESLTAVRLSRWHGAPATVIAERALQAGQADDPVQLAAALRALLAGQDCAGLPLSVVLSDDLVRLWQVTPPQGASRMSDIEAACALRFQTLYGEPLSNWRLACAPDARSPFFAAAMPRAVYDTVAAFAEESAMPLVAMAPQFVTAFNRWRKELRADAWFALVHGGLLTLGAHDGQQMLAVRSMPMPADAGATWLRAQLEREALRLDLPCPQSVQGCGQLPQAWVDGDDITVTRLDLARRGMPAQSNGAALAQTGARA
jgi:hypothetical protein